MVGAGVMLENLGQHLCLVVLDITGSEQKRDRGAVLLDIADQVQQLTVRAELFSVPLAEGLPSVDVVSVPLPQLRAGGDIPKPEVDARLLLGDTPWPEPIDQDPIAVRGGVPFVDALHPDGHITLSSR